MSKSEKRLSEVGSSTGIPLQRHKEEQNEVWSLLPNVPWWCGSGQEVNISGHLYLSTFQWLLAGYNWDFPLWGLCQGMRSQSPTVHGFSVSIPHHQFLNKLNAFLQLPIKPVTEIDYSNNQLVHQQQAQPNVSAEGILSTHKNLSKRIVKF